jgi:sugar lactone lactonase YvrE
MRTVGAGKFVYQENNHWAKFPAGWADHDIAAVGVDSQDRVYAFARTPTGGCVLTFSPQGDLLSIWGEGLFQRPHGLSIDHQDQVLCTDDAGQAVFIFSRQGELRQKIASPLFRFPTNACRAPDGNIYVSDGYGNAQVHAFDSDGRLLFSWGSPGQGPGQFDVPHSVRLDPAGRVFVADRMNARFQIFDPRGAYCGEWNEIRRPDDVCFDAAGNAYVAELGYVMQGDPGKWQPVSGALPPRITIRDTGGQILAEWEADDPLGADLFYAPHMMAINSRGDLFVSDVQETYSNHKVKTARPGLQAYQRVAA